MSVRRCFLALSALLLVALLLLLPAPSLAQGQFEGWDLVVKDNFGWIFKLNLVKSSSDFHTYSGELFFLGSDRSYTGYASASWNSTKDMLTIAAIDAMVSRSIILSFDDVSERGIFYGNWFYFINPTNMRTGWAQIIHGFLP